MIPKPKLWSRAHAPDAPQQWPNLSVYPSFHVNITEDVKHKAHGRSRTVCSLMARSGHGEATAREMVPPSAHLALFGARAVESAGSGSHPRTASVFMSVLPGRSSDVGCQPRSEVPTLGQTLPAPTPQLVRCCAFGPQPCPECVFTLKTWEIALKYRFHLHIS